MAENHNKKKKEKMIFEKLENKMQYCRTPSDDNNRKFRAVVVAQLVEWSLSTSEICSSNPIIGKCLI